MLKRKSKKDSEPNPKQGKRQASASNPQGITAKGNALYRIAALALLATLVPVALGFAYLTLLRDPALQDRQIDRVSTAFAVQQATNVHRLFSRMEDRMRGAAKSPLALSAIASQTNEDIGLVEKAMLDYFPEVISLRIIPLGEMGTADFEGGSQGLRNHIEVDLVRRTGAGQTTQPDSYQFEGRWLTSLAALVEHPRITNRQAVIITTIDNQVVTDQLKSLDTGAGKFALEQVYVSSTGVERTDTIAVSGSGDVEEYTRRSEIPDSSWQLAFTPSRALLSELTIDPLPVLIILALCVVAALAAFGIVVILFPRALDKEVNKVISAADRKSPLELKIPQLVSIAKQLRRATLRTLRQTSSYQEELPRAEVETLPPRGQGADLTNPMFQSGSILDEEDDSLDLNLAKPAEAVGGAVMDADGGFPNHIFRAYDIRGNAETELTDELVEKIGRAVGTIAGEMDEQSLIVGCDGRTSSPRIKSALIRALMETGRDIIDIGLVPTPLLYFATRHLNCRSGIMITGSHNPADDNGLKIVLNQQTIAAGGIQQIRDRVLR